MTVLHASELRRQRDAQLYNTIFDLLSLGKIFFNGKSSGGPVRCSEAVAPVPWGYPSE